MTRKHPMMTIVALGAIVLALAIFRLMVGVETVQTPFESVSFFASLSRFHLLEEWALV